MKSQFAFILKVVLGGLVMIVLVSGCGQQGSSGSESPVLVLVDDYAITADDLTLHRSRSLLPGVDPMAGPKDSYLIDMLIDEVLLLQEAQRRQIVRDPQFLKSIERYWQQSLIQELLSREMAVIRKSINTSDEALRRAYDDLKRLYLVREIVVPLSLTLADGSLNSENFDSFADGITDAHLMDSEWIWVDLRDIRGPFRETLRQEDPRGQVLRYEEPLLGRIIVLCVRDFEVQDLESFTEMVDEIREWLSREEEEAKLGAWLDTLRREARIQENPEAIQALSSQTVRAPH